MLHHDNFNTVHKCKEGGCIKRQKKVFYQIKKHVGLEIKCFQNLSHQARYIYSSIHVSIAVWSPDQQLPILLTTCLVNSCSFGLLCVYIVKVYQCVCVVCVSVCLCLCVCFPFSFGDGMWNFTVLVPDHCLSFYFM